MKTKLLVILCIMILAGACMVGPVAAAGSVATVTGNPEDFISINEAGDITNWVFTRDYENVNSSNCRLTVVTNHMGWTVGVHDALLELKPVGTAGKMVEYNTGTSAYIDPSPKVLIHNMTITGVAVPDYYSATEVILGGVNPPGPGSQVVWTGSSTYPTGIGTFNTMIITIKQQVDNEDQHLLVPNVYRIVVTFTAGLP